MLSIDIIEAKPFRIDPKTQTQILDLLVPCWDTKNVQYNLRSIAIVTDETEMRPDLVALSYQGEMTQLGTLLKLNNISNPLSLKAGEVLAVPSQTMTTNLFNSGKNYVDQKQKARTFRKELQEKVSKISQQRLEYLNSKNISNLAQTPVTPNILQEGQQQILVQDGKLIFGPDIGNCRTRVKKNISIVDVKAKLAEKNIFNR